MSHLTGEVKRLVSMLTKYDQVRGRGRGGAGVAGRRGWQAAHRKGWSSTEGRPGERPGAQRGQRESPAITTDHAANARCPARPLQDNYPEMLGRICIINAPMVFKAVWALVKPMLNPRTLNKIQVRAPHPRAAGAPPVDAAAASERGVPRAGLHPCVAEQPPCRCLHPRPADLQHQLHRGPAGVGGRGEPAALARRAIQGGRAWVGVAGSLLACERFPRPASRPPPHRIPSCPAPQGTLLDDVGPWSDPEVLQRLGPGLPAANKALKALRVSISSSAPVGLIEDEDGYQSPKCGGAWGGGGWLWAGLEGRRACPGKGRGWCWGAIEPAPRWACPAPSSQVRGVLRVGALHQQQPGRGPQRAAALASVAHADVARRRQKAVVAAAAAAAAAAGAGGRGAAGGAA
jgi:hypothetical protein